MEERDLDKDARADAPREESGTEPIPSPTSDDRRTPPPRAASRPVQVARPRSRATSGTDLADLAFGHANRGLEENLRIQRELVNATSPLRGLPAAFAATGPAERAMADLRRGGGTGTMRSLAEIASGTLAAAGGIDGIILRHREMERGVAALGGFEAIERRHRRAELDLARLGGFDWVGRRHSALAGALDGLAAVRASLDPARDLVSLSGRATAGAASNFQMRAAAVSRSIDEAMRAITGVTSFAGLIGRGGLEGARLVTVVEDALSWRAGRRGTPLSRTLRERHPDLFPHLRRASAADFAGLDLSRTGERFLRDSGRLERLKEQMLGIRRPWVDADAPRVSVTAFVEASALTEAISTLPAGSRAVVEAVRTELGDLRGSEVVPEEVSDDPVLRAAYRLDAGSDPALGALTPAVMARLLSGQPGLSRIERAVDQDQLHAILHGQMRRLELKLRRFIDERMRVAVGSKWIKQRVSPEIQERWHDRREVDRGGGRPAGPLIEYAGFEDYRLIIERRDNWDEAFRAVFGTKPPVLEALRRLSLIRNPIAHFRTITVDDLIDFAAERRRLDDWIERARG